MGKNKLSLSLAMIVKNEESRLPILWQSVKNIVDEWVVVDTGSSDRTVQVARELGAIVFEEGERFTTTLSPAHKEFFAGYGVEVEEGERVFNFAEARNYSFSKCTKDFILWLDGDDLLVGSRKLREIIDGNLEKDAQVGLHLLYKYETDKWGNSIVEHYRERVLPNNGSCKWVGRIHEIVVPSKETSYIQVEPADCHVLHVVEEDSRKRSGTRNLRNLLLDLYEQKDSPDPRTLFYLAEALKIMRNEKSLELYEQYTKLSGWDEELCLVATRLSDGYLMKGDTSKALDWAFKAVQYKPDFPMGYANVAQVYYELERYSECELFCKRALELKQPETLILVNKKHNEFTPLLLLVDCYFKSGKIKECMEMADEALLIEPTNEFLLETKEACWEIKMDEEVGAGFKTISDRLLKGGEVLKASKLLECIPSRQKDDPRLVGLQIKVGEKVGKLRGAGMLRVEKVEGEDDLLMMLRKSLKDKGYKTLKFVGVESPLFLEWMKDDGIEIVKRDEKVDCVAVLGGLIERFESPAQILKETLPYLKDGGMVVVGTTRDGEKFHSFSNETLDEMMELNGWTVWTNLTLPSERIYAELFPGKLTLPSIGFLCGESTEEWNPFSIYKGAGGSEEATVYLTRELASIGHPVVVYNTTTKGMTVDGVKYRHHSSLNQTVEMDVCVLWRTPHLITDYKVNAKRVVLWLHDVPQEHWFTKERMGMIDKVVVLSEYHKSLLPFIDQEKVIVSQNGVDVAQFASTPPRNPTQVIYTSSYDRGLEHLLDIWPSVVNEVPSATLKVFYGWGSFDKLRIEEHHKRWKSEMMRKLETTPGVVEGGRIGQLKLAEEFLSSGVFAYPCHFEEISCISAMKSQVAGCAPLTTDYSALAETNLTTYKVKGNPKYEEGVKEEFKKRLIELLKNPISEEERNSIKVGAIKRFNWKSVATEWSKFLTTNLGGAL